MASTGNVFPTVGANVDRGGSSNVWTSPGNVVADDGSSASVGVPSDYLVTSGYPLSVPALATINGVTVRIEASETGSGNSNYIPQLQIDTTPTLIGSPKSAITIATGPTISTSGSDTDLWDATLTPAIVNDAGFGATLWSTDTTNTLSIDFVTIDVAFTTVPLTREMDAPLSAARSRVAISDGFIGPNLLLTTLAPPEVEDPLLRGPVFVDRPRERAPDFLEPQANLLLSLLLAGPIQQAVDGSVAIAGAVVKLTATSKAASVSIAGSILRQTSKVLTAAVAFAGALVKETRRALTGSVAITATLETLRVFLRTLTGSVAIAGTVIRDTRKLVTGTATSAGALIRSVSHGLTGALTSAGGLVKQARTSLAGTVASSSTLTAIRVFLRSLTGSVASAGELARLPLKSLEGSIAIAGSIQRAISKTLDGAVAIAGAVTKFFAVTLAGVVAIAGALVGSIPSSVFTVVHRVRSRVTTFRTSLKNRTHTVRPKS